MLLDKQAVLLVMLQLHPHQVRLRQAVELCEDKSSSGRQQVIPLKQHSAALGRPARTGCLMYAWFMPVHVPCPLLQQVHNETAGSVPWPRIV